MDSGTSESEKSKRETDHAITFLGFIKKAGKLSCGELSCREAVEKKKAKLILTAADAAENTRVHAERLAALGRIPYLELPCSKAQLGHVLSREECAVCAVCDKGFAGAVLKKFDSADKIL